MNNISPGSGIAVPYFAPDTASLSSPGSTSANFGDVLKGAIHAVDALHNDAAGQVGNLLQGGGTDVHNVMIAVEKADVAFQLMMQVRNKIVSAYQDIEKMQF